MECIMKAIVLQAQVKDLLNFIKASSDVDRDFLIETNKKLLKIMTEVTETLEKVEKVA